MLLAVLLPVFIMFDRAYVKPDRRKKAALVQCLTVGLAHLLLRDRGAGFTKLGSGTAFWPTVVQKVGSLPKKAWLLNNAAPVG
mmetsp:Transcript_68521/g.210097  ORF Transcript_68521/g.210097 Transcript_68521/m.210097 type:complete len:83 (+) Transcript_68521:71-319(+)